MKGEEITSEGRILAVKIDGKLFDKIDELVEQEGITKQKYMTDLISKDISQRMQQQAAQQKELEIKLTDGQKVWDRAEVMDAIDNYMLREKRIPRQIDFKNENGHPSYGAAGRALDMSPAEYMKERFEELSIVQESQTEGMNLMNM